VFGNVATGVGDFSLFNFSIITYTGTVVNTNSNVSKLWPKLE
jgi:hypothetical protein